MRNGWLAFSLLAAACVGAAARPVIFPAAGAAAPTERCDWRYIAESGEPSIPEAADSKPMSQEWTTMSAAGYRLVAIRSNSGNNVGYIFERCVLAQ